MGSKEYRGLRYGVELNLWRERGERERVIIRFIAKMKSEPFTAEIRRPRMETTPRQGPRIHLREGGRFIVHKPFPVSLILFQCDDMHIWTFERKKCISAETSDTQIECFCHILLTLLPLSKTLRPPTKTMRP